jgi:hypothetical protein
VEVGPKRAYQFKIDLKGIRPPIWRRILVPEEYSFWDLHIAIQDAMGWSGYHLHEFEVPCPPHGLKVRIGIPDEEFAKGEVLPGWEEMIADYFSARRRVGLYVYDFGDNWEHILRLEKILPREDDIRYPVCIAGRRACPPEDCGGVWGYEELLRGEGEAQEYYEDFDPECFGVEEVVFRDPHKVPRWADN